MSTVDVIIPTYKPDYSLFTLIDDLEKQSLRPSKIIIMNTEEKYWNDLNENNPENPLKKYDNIIIRHIKKTEFDHGETRNQGVLLSDAELFLMMTQDAFPKDRMLLAIHFSIKILHL